MYTAAYAFFEALSEAGVTYCFVNLGSDHPSLVEAFLEGQNENKGNFPRLVTCPNEMVAMAMADGYARLTGKPQCVIVHVDVGTQNLGCAVHDATMGRCPVLIFAGLSPFTIEGELRGSRTEYIHWVQDVPDQKQIIGQYCRYAGEIKTGKTVKQMVNRALSFAKSDPKGPVYLVAAREILAQEIEPYELKQDFWNPVEPAALSSNAVNRIAEGLVNAKEPLIIAGYAGRNHNFAPELVKLANLVKGVRVLDTSGSDMCFPADHRGWLGMRHGDDESIKTADFILVIDTDTPWIHSRVQPKKDCKIFHIDVDPLKHMMPVFYINALARFSADAYTAVNQIVTHIESNDSLRTKVNSSDYEKRWEALSASYNSRLSKISSLAINKSDGTFGVHYLMSRVRAAVPADTFWVIEAVTNATNVHDQVQPTQPGHWINCAGGGLGWPGGDGTFMFSVPSSVYWIASRYGIPTLTIVLGNSGWQAPKRSALAVYPKGLASKATDQQLNISFAPNPDYAGVAKAAAGGRLYAAQAGTADVLEEKLKEAVQSVKQGVSAVLDCHLGGSEGKYVEKSNL